jgi:maleate isomerase
VIGSETVLKMIKKGCNTGEVCNPISSLIDACNYMKINDILFLSPYVSDVSNRLIAEIRSYGITTTVVGSFNEEIEQNVARIKPRSIVEAVRDIYSGQTAIFISCTNLQTLDVIEVIEQEFSCVCFSSNQVLIWNMLRLAKIDCDVTGYGKLLSKISKE